VCTGIRPVADVGIAAAKDGSCGCDEVLLECLEKNQRLEDGTGSVGQFYVATYCEDFSGSLVKDGG
jgi:hypothetical protein